MRRVLMTIAMAVALFGVAVAQPTTAPATRPALLPEKGEPAFALWDGGVYLLSKPRRVLFAAWADGTVAREVGHSTRPGRVLHDATGRTVGRETIIDQAFRVGRVPPERVQALIDEAVAAGFDSARKINTVRPDGPFQIVEIRRDGELRSRTHDQTALARDDLDTRSSPTPAEVNAYVELWRRIGVAIERLRPEDEQPLELRP